MSALDLRCEDVATMIASLPDESAAFVMADPPWSYEHGNNQGGVDEQYAGLSEAQIAAHLASTYRIAARDCYLACWCTFPKLGEWMARPQQKRNAGEVTAEFLALYGGLMPPELFAHLHERMQPAPLSPHELLEAAGWTYISGAAWGKTNGLGVGYHFRGDAELLLLYKKGHPRPLDGSQSNLWVTGAVGGLALASRTGHSEKPQGALQPLVSMAAPVGGLVVDCYAGESASLARACRALGRAYRGAELDPARHARALIRLSQQEMFTTGGAA